MILLLQPFAVGHHSVGLDIFQLAPLYQPFQGILAPSLGPLLWSH